MAEWEDVGELNSPSSAGAVVPLLGGRALLTGVDSFNRRRVELYDPSTPTKFTGVANALSPLRFHFAVTLADDRVLVGGGGDFFNRTGLRRKCYIYTPPYHPPPNDTWVEVAPLPRRSFWIYTKPAALLNDGRVIVTGGSTPQEAYYDNDVESDIYVASRNVFIFTPSGQTQLPDGTSLPGSWVEDTPMPETGKFTHAPPFSVSIDSGEPVDGIDLDGKTIKSGRAGHATVVLPNGNVLLIGGRQYQPGEFYGVPWIDQYHPGTKQWTRLAQMPSVPAEGDGGYGGRGFPGVALLPRVPLLGLSERVLIAGGTAVRLVMQTTPGAGGETLDATFEVHGSTLPRGSTRLFDPATNGFETVDDLSLPRTFPFATPLDSMFGRRAIVIGGESTYEDAPVYPEVFFDLFYNVDSWSSLLCEPYPTFPDYSPRMGTALTDGAVLTWSSIPYWAEPEFEGSGALRVAKRLHPPW